MNTFGRVFRATTFGESFSAAVGAVIDGCPSGIRLGANDIQRELDRRKPGQSILASQRKESDRAEILSGTLDGKTLGTPIAVMVKNEDADEKPYEKIKDLLRPGHADFTYREKYGHVDWRGGSRASGRETVGRVIGGAIAKKFLSFKKIEVTGHVSEIAGIVAKKMDFDGIAKNSDKTAVRCADLKAARKMESAILASRNGRDSLGGIAEIRARGVPPGLGEPVFGKLDAEIAVAMMSIGSVKGVEIGSGFAASQMKGSENNDAFYMKNGKVSLRSNNAGGILGGISTGEEIVVRIAVKPTPSIARKQDTVNVKTMKDSEIEVMGRHDPCICPRIVPVAEAMLSLTLADNYLLWSAYENSKAR
ncbi:MAG: chorismate synthase [Candidatus Aenigmarchaeota archaeon]|nr:chorismate synthase [Candidatus Aenigmarchaeota archaeon]